MDSHDLFMGALESSRRFGNTPPLSHRPPKIMNPSRPLTQEELDYIQLLFDESEQAERVPSTEIGLVTTPDNIALFDQLIHSSTIQLRANHGNLGFVFPVRLHKEADGHLSMELAMPAIYELHGERVRSWRAPMGGDAVRLIDPSGRLGNARVIDISTSGIAFVDEGEEALPEGARLPGLFLELPGSASPLPVTGTVVRIYGGHFSGKPRLAIRFHNPEEGLQAAIRDFVFRRHRELRDDGAE